MLDNAILLYDESIYSIDAIEMAAYRASNFFTTNFSKVDGKISCSLTANIGVSDNQFSHAIEDFKKEVLDQQLRIKLKAETEPIRNLILGIAFSNTGLQDSE